MYRSDLPGKPDFVFPSSKLVVFVDGCFWHGCPNCYRRPRSNREYWDGKAKRNRARDREVNRALSSMGWRVMRFWEHEVLGDLPDVCGRVRTCVRGRRKS